MASGYSQLSRWEDKGYSQKVTITGRGVKVTIVQRLWPAKGCDPRRFLNPLLHLGLQPCKIAHVHKNK